MAFDIFIGGESDDDEPGREPGFKSVDDKNYDVFLDEKDQNTKLPLSLKQKVGYVDKRVEKGFRDLGEFAMDAVAFPATLAERHMRGMGGALSGGDGFIDSVTNWPERYMEQFRQKTRVGKEGFMNSGDVNDGVEIGDITRATTHPQGMNNSFSLDPRRDLNDPNYQPSEDVQLLPEGYTEEDLDPVTQFAGDTAELATNLAGGGIMGPSKWAAQAGKAFPTMLAGGTVGREGAELAGLDGTYGELGGIILGAFTTPKGVVDMIKALPELPTNIKNAFGNIDFATASEKTMRQVMAMIELNVDMPIGAKFNKFADDMIDTVAKARQMDMPGTVGQLTKNKGLLQAEGALAEQSRPYQQQLEIHNQKINELAQKPMADVAPGGVLPRATEQQRGMVAEEITDIAETADKASALKKSTAQADVNAAAQAQDTAVAPFAAQDSRTAASSKLSESLNAEYKTQKQLAAKMFDQLPDGGKIKPDDIKIYWDDYWKGAVNDPVVRKQFEKAFKSTMDDYNLIQDAGGKVSIEALNGMLSTMSRESGTVLNKSATRHVEGLTEYMYNVIDTVAPGMGGKAEEARTFYKGLMQKFGSHTKVGKAIDAREFEAGKTLLKTGETGAANIVDLKKAAPGSMKDAENYYRAVVNKATLKDGTVNENAIKSFLHNNTEMLEQFPKIKTEAESLLASAKQTKAAQTGVKTAEKDVVSIRAEQLRDTATAEKSAAAKFGRQGEDTVAIRKQVKRILSPKESANRTEDIKTLIVNAKQRSGGMDDLQRTFVDEMETAFKTNSKGKLTKQVQEGSIDKFKQNRQAYEDSGLLNKAQLDGIEKGLETGDMMYAHATAKSLAELSPTQRKMAEAVAALFGAKVGALAFGSPLIGAAIGRKTAVDYFKKIGTKNIEKIAGELLADPDKYIAASKKYKLPPGEQTLPPETLVELWKVALKAAIVKEGTE